MDKVATSVPSKYLAGTGGDTEPMTTQGFSNPGPTDRLRGVEKNTGKRDAVWGPVAIEGVTDLCDWSVDPSPPYRVRED